MYNKIYANRQYNLKCDKVITQNGSSGVVVQYNQNNYLFYLLETQNNEVEVITLNNCQQVNMNNIQVCDQCIEGYVFNLKTLFCIKCSDQIQNCQTCQYQSNILVCLSCFQDYYLQPLNSKTQNQQCLLCSQTFKGCKNCNINGCIQCQDGYLEQFSSQNNQTTCLIQLQCAASNSQIIQIDQAQCLWCHQQVDQNCRICQIDFLNNSYSCLNYCNQYRQYYNKSNNACQPCSENCLQCNEKGCTQCDINYLLNNNNQCILMCALENCSQCQEIQTQINLQKQVECASCLSTNQVFSFDMKKCMSCGTGCSLCSQNGKCLACQQNYFYDSSIKQCVQCSQFQYCEIKLLITKYLSCGGEMNLISKSKQIQEVYGTNLIDINQINIISFDNEIQTLYQDQIYDVEINLIMLSQNCVLYQDIIFQTSYENVHINFEGRNSVIDMNRSEMYLINLQGFSLQNIEFAALFQRQTTSYYVQPIFIQRSKYYQNSQFNLTNITFQNNTSVQFVLDQFETIIIANFSILFQNKWGYSLFNTIQKEELLDYTQHIFIQDFYAQNLILINETFFQINQKSNNYKILVSNLTFNNSYFEQFSLIQNQNYINGQSSMLIDNFNFINCQILNSSIIQNQFNSSSISIYNLKIQNSTILNFDKKVINLFQVQQVDQLNGVIIENSTFYNYKVIQAQNYNKSILIQNIFLQNLQIIFDLDTLNQTQSSLFSFVLQNQLKIFNQTQNNIQLLNYKIIDNIPNISSFWNSMSINSLIGPISSQIKLLNKSEIFYEQKQQKQIVINNKGILNISQKISIVQITQLRSKIQISNQIQLNKINASNITGIRILSICSQNFVSFSNLIISNANNALVHLENVNNSIDTHLSITDSSINNIQLLDQSMFQFFNYFQVEMTKINISNILLENKNNLEYINLFTIDNNLYNIQSREQISSFSVNLTNLMFDLFIIIPEQYSSTLLYLQNYQNFLIQNTIFSNFLINQNAYTISLQNIQNILITNTTVKNGNQMQNSINYNNFFYGSIIFANNFNRIQLQNSAFYNIQLNSQGILKLCPGYQSEVSVNYLQMQSIFIILDIELQQNNLVQSDQRTLNGGIIQMNISYIQQIQINIDNLSISNFRVSEYFVVQWIYLINDANKKLFFGMSNSIVEKIEGNLFYYQSYYQVQRMDMTNSEIWFNNITVQNCSCIHSNNQHLNISQAFGLIVIKQPVQLLISHSLFYDNQYPFLILSILSYNSIHSTQFKNNQVTSNYFSYQNQILSASPLVFQNSLIDIDSSIFKNNKGFDGGTINLNSQISVKEVLSRNLGESKQKLIKSVTNEKQSYRKLKLFQYNSINNCLFDNNFSSKNGGALNILNSDIQLSNNTFSFNQASENGGSIFYYTNSSLCKNNTMVVSKQTQFISNNALKGSAIRAIGQIQYSNDSIFTNNTSYYDNYNPILTDCIEGEYIGSYNYCDICPSGTYSLIKNTKECFNCPAFCKCLGGSIIEVQKGYWRPNIYSDQISQCWQDDSVCLGGSTNFTCQEGYTGALCKSCDIHGIHTQGTPYSSQIGQFDKCTPCISLIAIVLQIIFLFLVSFITMIVSVTGTVKLSNTLLLQKNLGRFFLDFSQGQTIYPTYILKIFTHYIQIVGIFFSNQFNLISQLINIQSLIGNSTKMFSYQIDCLLVRIKVSYPLIYLRIIALLTYTAILSFVFTLIFSILLKLKIYTSRISVIYLNSLIFIYIYFQPVATQQLSSIISCQQISGESYISADLQYECNDENYNQIVYPYIYPIFILLNAIIPAFFIIKLYLSYKNKLLDTHYCRSVLGYLYNEYRQSRFYWELIKVFEKIALISINQIYLNSIQTKGFLSFMIISLYSLLSNRMQPYNHLSLNKLNSISTSISGITIILILFLTTNQSSFFNFVGIAILCIINMYFILQVLRLLVYQYTRLFMRHLDALKAYLITKFPFLKKYFKMRIDRHRKTLAYWKIFRKHVQNYIKIVKGANQLHMDKNYIDREIKDRLKNYLLNPQERQNTLNRCIRSQVFEEEEILPAIQVVGLKKLDNNNLNIEIPSLPKKSLNRTSIIFQIRDGVSNTQNLEQSHISAVEEENSKQTVDSHNSSEQSQKITQKKECEKYIVSPDMSQLNNSNSISESDNQVKKNINRASTKNYDLEEQKEEQNNFLNINLSCCLNQINISKFNSYFHQD
ncbi:hypothetical protein ABPG72_018939 [Tetrahymena utriculariae]